MSEHDEMAQLRRVTTLYRALFPPGKFTDQYDAAYEALKAPELEAILKKFSLHELRTVLQAVVPAVCASMIAKAEKPNEQA